jgi:hypothetical protein
MTPLISLSRAMSDPNLFGKTFAAPSFWTWRVVAKLIDGIELKTSRITWLVAIVISSTPCM